MKADRLLSPVDRGISEQVPLLLALLPAHKVHLYKDSPGGLKLFIRTRKRVKLQNHEEVGLDTQLPLGFPATV